MFIFDLDGTILSINSFPYWARYMLRGKFDGLNAWERLQLSLRTGKILFDRKVLKHPHDRTKRRLQALWTQAIEKDISETALQRLHAQLQAHIRPNMQSLLQRVANRQVDAILATSAAGEYAEGLGKSLGFAHVLTSDAEENRGERKCAQVMEMIAAHGWNGRQRIFFTDHEEDLPLIHQCHRVFWLGKKEDIAMIQANAPLTHVVIWHENAETEIMPLVTKEAPASPDKSPAIHQYG